MKTASELLTSLNEGRARGTNAAWDHPTKKGYTFSHALSDNTMAGFTTSDGEQVYMRRSSLPDNHPARHPKKKVVKESTLLQALDILEDLETEDEIAEFLETLDEDTYAEVEDALNEVELDEDQDAVRAKIASLQADLKAVKGNAPGDARNRGLLRSEIFGLKQRLKGKNESTLERAISNYRELSEGTWTLTSKDGIQKRFKDDKSQAAKDWVSGNQKKEKTMSAKAFASSWIKKNIGDPRVPKAPAVSLDTIWRKVEDVVGNIYPDGDPIDYLGPWCKKQGIDYSMVDKAAKKHGFKDVYAYWDSMGEHLG